MCSSEGEVLAEYAKMHLFRPLGEDQYGTAGMNPVCFLYPGLKIGLSICFDLRFPELYRHYLHDWCQCIIVQAAWPAARIADWELLMKVRALENQCYLIGANCIGYDAGYDAVAQTEYGGRSMVCDYGIYIFCRIYFIC